MPDNRLTLTIEAQNLAQAAFKQFQTDVRQSNEALQKTGQAGRQSSTGIKVLRDELGRFHDVATGRFVSAARVAANGYEILDKQIDNTTRSGRNFRKELQAQVSALHEVTQTLGLAANATKKLISTQVDAALAFERQQVGLRAISGSIIETTTLYRDLVEAARLPGITLRSAAEITQAFLAVGKSGEEAIRITKLLGNAAAISNVTAGGLRNVGNALIQITSEGRIHQQDLSRITSRLPILSRAYTDLYGSPRAERIRQFYESIGQGENAAQLFVAKTLELMEDLPTAYDTAFNSVENFHDSLERASAAIGTNYLPTLREAIAAFEKFSMRIENEPDLARSIATVQAFGGAFLSVSASLSGAAALLVRFGPALRTFVTGPVGLAITGAGLLAGALASVETHFNGLVATFDSQRQRIKENTELLRSFREAAVGDLSEGAARDQLGTAEAALKGLEKQLQNARNALIDNASQLKENEAAYDRISTALDTTHLSYRDGRAVLEGRKTGLESENEALRTNRQEIENSIHIAERQIAVTQDRINQLKEYTSGTDSATVSIQSFKKALSGLQDDLKEEVVVESLRGKFFDENNFKKATDALIDIETLVSQSADSLTKLRESAASDNQAAKTLESINRQVDALRDSQADRYINNLSAAFENVANAADPSRKQLEAILKSAEGFVTTFQGGADVLQDDVSRALGLISQVREQLQGLTADELRLEAHDEGAQGLTEALLRFYDLQSAVQEDAGVDAQRSTEKQATAYIRAYRDSIDPAILNLVESVKILRTELRGSIQDLEALNLRDKFTLEFQGEIGGERSDALAELFDLNEAVQDGIRENEIANLRKRSVALREKLSDDTVSLQQYQTDVIAILRSLYDAERAFQAVDVREDLNKRQAENARKLSQTILALEDATKDGQIERILKTAQERQRALAGSEGALKVIYDRFVQLEQDAQDKLGEIISGGEVADARKNLLRLEERALDAASQRQRENLIRETQQFVDAYAQRGEAFRNLVTDAQELGGELQEAFDLTEQMERLEDFQDSVAGVLDNLASIAIDHIFDSFSDSAQRATDAVGTFVDEVRGELQLLQNDITRLTRFDEDQGVRRQRLIEDRDRRLAQLQRERQTLAARSPTGDQGAIERNTQRQQDLTARITRLREDFGVRLSRFDEDTDRRRSRTIEDSIDRRENFENRGTDDSLVSKLVGSLTSSLSNTLSSTISTAIASALGGALGGQFTGLVDAIKGLFGGGAGTTPAVTTPSTPAADTGTSDDTSGRITLSKDDITPPAEAIDLQGAVSLALSDITAPVEAVALKGAISLALTDITAPVEAVPLRGDITEITVSAIPPIINLKGIINDLMVDGAAAVPAVNPAAIIQSITTDPAAEVPQVNPAAVVRSVVVDPSAEIPVVNPSGVINSLEIGADTQTPVVNPAGVIRSLSVSPDAVTPEVNPDGVIRSLSIDPSVPPLAVDMTGNISEINIDPSTIPPLDLSGIGVNLPNIPPINVPVNVTPTIQTPRQQSPAGQPSETETTGGGRTASTPGQTTAAIVANEGRRDKVFGSGNPTVQTSISSEELAQALAQGQRASQEGTGFFNPATALAEGLQSLVNAVLSSGVSVGGDGVSLGADAGGLTNAQVEALAASLGEDLDSSFRSDFIPTLLGNQPGTVQPGNADPDDETAQAPAAPRFNQAAAAGVSAVADVLSLEALANVAQETTLAGIAATLDRVQLATERVADAPLVQGLIDAGIAFPNDPQDPTNAAFTQSPIQDILGRGGLSLFAGFDAINSNLETLRNLQGLAEPTPDLSQMPGGSEGTPMYAHIVNQPQVQDVRLVGGVLDGVKDTLKAKVEGTVDVKQVGVVQVTQSGEWVMQLASGQTIPVYVQGGSVQANLSQGGISTLAELIDVENQRRDAFNTAI